MIHSFLLIGQSNMAGRGFVSETAPIENENVHVMRNGRWMFLYSPVNPDRPFSGVCLAESFADTYAKERGVEVGLIPCADGGTRLDQWVPGGLLYDNAVYMSRLAMRTSTIAGVLWHQGESDCADGAYQKYEEKFVNIMNSLRRDLGLYDVPFILGGLGDFLKNRPDDGMAENYQKVNATLENIARTNAMTGFVPAKGLSSNPDNLHFNAASLREFGLRYYDVFKNIEDKNKVFEEKASEDAALRTAIELL